MYENLSIDQISQTTKPFVYANTKPRLLLPLSLSYTRWLSYLYTSLALLLGCVALWEGVNVDEILFQQILRSKLVHSGSRKRQFVVSIKFACR